MSVDKTKIRSALSLENVAREGLVPLPSAVEVSEVMFSDSITRIRVFLGLSVEDTETKEESEHIQTQAHPLLFSQEKPSALVRFFKGKSNERLTKDDIIKKAKAFCVARQHYFLGVIKLFKTGSFADIEAYYGTLINARKVTIKKTELSEIRPSVISGCQELCDFYTEVFNLLNNGKYDAAFFRCYQEQVRIQNAWDSAKYKSKMSYEYKRNDCELFHVIEIVKLLRPCTSVLFFQKIEYYCKFEMTMSHVLSSPFAPATCVITFKTPTYIKEKEEIFNEHFLVPKDICFNNTILPDGYKEILVQKVDIIKEEWRSIILKFKDIKDPGGRQFNDYVKALQLIDKVLNDAKMLAESATNSKQKAHVLKVRILQIQQEIEQCLKEFTQQVTKVFNSPAGNCDLFKKQKEKNIKQESDAIQVAFEFIKNSLNTIIFQFNGENSEMLTQIVQDVADKIIDLRTEGLLFVAHIKKMSEDLYAKQQGHAAAIEMAAKTKEEENEKMITESQKAYQEKAQQHKVAVVLNRQTKEKLAEEKRRTESAKRLELAKSKDAKESRDIKEISEAQLKSLELNNTQINLLKEIFSDPTPHHKICYQEVVNLIKALGGEIESSGGSHRHIKMICLHDTIGFADYQEDNAELSATASAASTASGILVKPHGKSHSPGTLSQFAVKQFRDVLERAGIRPTMVTPGNTAATGVATAAGSGGITNASSKESLLKK